MKTLQKIEFGDFQTPLPLAREVCALLQKLGIQAEVIVEPTCGRGSFIRATVEFFPHAHLAGFDVNKRHLDTARTELAELIAQQRLHLQEQDFFSFDWDFYFANEHRRVLLLGNLPWVTNSAISSLNGANLPKKENFQGLRGFAAKTGKSNFDISEWMLIRLIQALRGKEATLAILCKTATACKVLRHAWQTDGRVASAALYRISADEHFDASVDACLFVARLGHLGPREALVFTSLHSSEPERRVGLSGKDLVADLTTYEHLRNLEGLCPYQWRSGLKHDCASVMELEPLAYGRFRNKLGETVALETDFVYPLLKSTDLSKGNSVPRRAVLVTQRHPGDDTSAIAAAPLTWSYLNQHHKLFAARKSSIYSSKADFAIFGIGEYAFAPWKVAVSALHHTPRFVTVPSRESRPVMFDDTCNYLPFSNEEEAQAVADILNSKPCLQFLQSLIFPGTKRPVTIELLQRLNLSAIAEETDRAAAWRASRRIAYPEAGQTAQLQMVMEGHSGKRISKK
ncbi:MAG: SAM-dependent methyltransferase [Verrucomicrobiia bacterium]